MNGLHPGVQQELSARAQTCDTVAVEGASLKDGGHLCGMGAAVGSDARAAYLQGADGNVLCHAKAAGALGSHQPLVAGKAQHGNAHGLHVDGVGARRLAGIRHQQQAVGPGDAADLPQIQHVAGEVGGVGTDDGTGLPADEPGKVAVIHAAAPVRRDHGQADDARILQTVQGPQHGVVLQIGGDHVVARGEQAVYGGIQRLGGILRKGHLLRPGGIEQPGQAVAGGINRPGRLQRAAVGSPGGIAHAAQGFGDGGHHAVGLFQCGGRVIQIDHGRMTLPAAVSFSTMAYILVMEPTASLPSRP